jgi:hypothetical protein
MLKIIALAAFAFTFSTAQASENLVLEIDWSDKRTLDDSVVQQCDDSFYPAVEIVVPGKPGVDFHVEMSVGITNGKISPGCTLKGFKKGPRSTTYILDASGGCSIQVNKARKEPGDAGKQANFVLADAC